MRRNVVKYLLNDIRLRVPGCSVSMFAPESLVPVYESLDFVANPDGIHGMALAEDFEFEDDDEDDAWLRDEEP